MKNFLKTNPQWSEEQLKVYNSEPGVFVQGSAGTGKTLLAAHIAVKRNTTFKESVLILVQTKSLVSFIKHLISEINPNASIEVVYDYNLSNRESDSYDTLIVDEVFDFNNQRVEELRKLAKVGVYLFGDKEQVLSSYDKSFKQIEIKKLSFYSELKSFKLNKTYRVPIQTLRFIKDVFNNKSVVINENIVNELPNFFKFNNIIEEIDWLIKYVRSLVHENKYHNIGILFSVNDMRESISSILSNDSKPFYLPGISELVEMFTEKSIKVGYKYRNHNALDFSNDVNVNLLTIHSSKGLEFDHVIIPFVCLGNYNNSEFYKNLLYVASTRTSGTIVYSYTKFASEALKKDSLKKELYQGTLDNYEFLGERREKLFDHYQEKREGYINAIKDLAESNLTIKEKQERLKDIENKYRKD